MNDISRQLDLEEVAQRIHDAIHYGYPREAQRLLTDLVKTVARNPAACTDALDPHSESFATLRSAGS